MNFRNNQILAKSSPKEETVQNPDSSSETLDLLGEDTDTKSGFVNRSLKGEFRNDCGEDDDKNVKDCDGINLSLKVRKAAITLVKQKDDVISSEKDVKSRDSNRHVWRPY